MGNSGVPHFIDILKANVKNFKQIQSLEVELGTNAGDNYASIMLKVDISCDLKDASIQFVSYMLKIPFAHGKTKEILNRLNTFQKELLMYIEHIPQFEQAYKNVGIDIVFAPKSFKFSKDPGCAVVLKENLGPLCFKNTDRLQCLDKEHTKCVLRKLAKFHAASALFYATKGDFPEILKKSVFCEANRAVVQTINDSFCSTMLASIKTIVNSEEYIHKLQNYVKNLFDIMSEVSEYDVNMTVQAKF